MRKSVGVIEPIRDMKPSVALLSADIGKKRRHNEQTRDRSGKRNSRRDTKSRSDAGPVLTTAEPAAKRNPKMAPYPPPTNPMITEIFIIRSKRCHCDMNSDPRPIANSTKSSS